MSTKQIVFVGWSHEEENKLVENVKKVGKDNGKSKYKSRLNKLNWDEVAFGKYSADDCKKHFDLLLKKVRTYRILDEIIGDIQTTLAKVPYKKPLNSYHLFMKDMCGRGPNEGVHFLFIFYLIRCRGYSSYTIKNYR